MHLSLLFVHVAFGVQREPFVEGGLGVVRDSLSPGSLKYVLKDEGDEWQEERSFGMGDPEHEIYSPDWYLRAAAQVKKSEPVENPPKSDDSLFALEKFDFARIKSLSGKGTYRDFTHTWPRPDGLASIAHVFVNSAEEYYIYYPGANHNAGKGELHANKAGTPLPPRILKTLEIKMADYAREQTKLVVQKYHLDLQTLQKFGIIYHMRLRFDYTCSQLSHLSTGRRQTRRLASIFADVKAEVPHKRALEAARDLIRKNPLFNKKAEFQGKEVVVEDFVQLPSKLPMVFLGYIGDDFIPLEGQQTQPSSPAEADLQVEKNLSFLRFNQFTSQVRDSTMGMMGKALFRPKKIDADYEKLLLPVGAGYSVLNAVRTPPNDLDFLLQTTRSGAAVGGTAHVSGTCSEQELYEAEVIADICIQTPHPQGLYPFERFWVQCRGWYPKFTLAYVVHNTADNIQNRRPNTLSIRQCTEHGWVSVDHLFARQTPQEFMMVCNAAKTNKILYQFAPTAWSKNLLPSAQGSKQALAEVASGPDVYSRDLKHFHSPTSTNLKKEW
ncbi:hypothetical protein GNI_180910 [Gregarina niphandrodes]|uniref:Uncharacterized protein n=1 Tax=Gregarina niphandrodes TaxID=110365 RepID=A0A023AXM3_GRENI|nr:hypothetical protein GNI_180910 [Gregarina niphandrodes]EZG43238.1 hypothetical protein GNI_180910 [Gregarina niphandrodes]|eukprot:XP_011133506.1 hypothetical protein GNI_180910 [Gregarina niphandrodes]